MKKKIIIISFIIVLAGLTVSCTQNSSSEKDFTTAISAGNEGKKYYQIASDGQSTALFEIITDQSGNAVTNKQGQNQTLNRTTVITAQSKNKSHASSTSVNNKRNTSSNSTNSADNDIEFESSKNSMVIEKSTTRREEPPATNQTKTSSTTEKDTTKKPSEKTTETKKSEIVTDSDGWVDKWY